MSSLNLFLNDTDATEKLGAVLGTAFNEGGVLFLNGTLGAGKTTLTRGLLRAMGHKGAVKSPTYTLVEPYVFAGRSVYHFDLYRLADAEELEYMGMRDYFLNRNLCIIEWPERGAGFLPEADLNISLVVENNGRRATLEATTQAGKAAIKNIK